MYKKINKIVSRGPSFAQTYYDFIEDVIKNKQFDILKDVTYVKYKIDIDGFASTDIFKKESFKKILSFNVSKGFFLSSFILIYNYKFFNLVF